LLVAESRRSLAIALLSQFKDVDGTRATELLRLAADGYRSAHGDEDPDLAETKLWQARTLADSATQEAGQLLAEALHSFEARAPDDPRTISALNARASWAQYHGRFEEASALLDRSTELTERLFGDILATDMLRRHARLAYARGDASTAEQMSRKAVAHELVRWSARRPDDGARLRALAKRIEEPGSPSAEPPYAEAFSALRALEGNGSFELAQWMNGIAMTLMQLKRGSAVEPLLREALQIHCRAMGDDCPVRQRSIELLGQEMLAEGRGEGAVRELEESLATYLRLGANQSPEALRTADLLTACRECSAGKSGSEH
jgi:hypothetical protein